MNLYKFVTLFKNKAGKTGLLLGGLLPAREQYDAMRERRVKEGYEHRDLLTFEERFDLLWRIDSRGKYSPELEEIESVTSLAAIGGFIFAYTFKAKEVLEKFKVDNKHEMFKSPREAQNTARRDMGLHGATAGLKAAVKYGFMAFCFTFTTQLMNIYCNDILISGHAACGFVLGGCYRLISGPKAMLSAGLLGSICGSVHGLSKKSALWLIDTDYQGYLLKEYNKKILDDEAKAQLKKLENKTIRDSWHNSTEEEQSDPNQRNAFLRQLISVLQWFGSK